MSTEEATALIQDGRNWCAEVWMKNNTVYRDNMILKMNEALNPLNIKVGRGWQQYDPVVKVNNKPHTYAALVTWAIQQPDGGIAVAKQFQDWYSTTDVKLSALPDHLKALAVITHFAEVGRAYASSLDNYLYPWIDSIVKAAGKEQAKTLWLAYNSRFPPSLKYDQDLKNEWVG